MANWRSTPRSDKYDVNEDGLVRNHKTGHILKPCSTGCGYQKVGLYYDGEYHNERIHRLVAETFIDRPDGCDVVNHIDGDKRNNRVDNLEWCTSKDNSLHAYAMGLRYRPETSGVPARPVEILETGEHFKSASECARYIKASSSSVYACLNGRMKTCRGYTIIDIKERG